MDGSSWGPPESAVVQYCPNYFRPWFLPLNIILQFANLHFTNKLSIYLTSHGLVISTLSLEYGGPGSLHPTSSVFIAELSVQKAYVLRNSPVTTALPTWSCYQQQNQAEEASLQDHTNIPDPSQAFVVSKATNSDSSKRVHILFPVLLWPSSLFPNSKVCQCLTSVIIKDESQIPSALPCDMWIPIKVTP